MYRKVLSYLLSIIIVISTITSFSIVTYAKDFSGSSTGGEGTIGNIHYSYGGDVVPVLTLSGEGTVNKTNIPYNSLNGILNAYFEKVIIEAEITSIGSSAFNNWMRLSYVEIDGSVETIDSAAFANCPALTRVMILNKNTSIEDSAFSNCPNLTIYGFENTTVQEYAESHNISFSPMLIGDANLDGNINILDATAIQRHLAQIITFEKVAIAAANVNSDDDLSVIDATMIQRFIAQLIPSL